jgi:sulfite exporter TauE/SafE
MPWKGMVTFLTGRLLGYALAGALAAFAVQNLAWLTSQMGALRPVWTLFHVAVLMWGLVLLFMARQPVWVDGIGRHFWARLRGRMQGNSWVVLVGAAWALMPCGLLYSALLVASLSGGPLDGALAMALFAVGSSITLAIGPWLWVRLQAWRDPARQAWSMRAAGASLTAVAAWALVHDLDPRFVDYCRSVLSL